MQIYDILNSLSRKRSKMGANVFQKQNDNRPPAQTQKTTNATDVKRDAKQPPRDSHKMTRDLKPLQRFKIPCDTLQPQRDHHQDAK